MKITASLTQVSAKASLQPCFESKTLKSGEISGFITDDKIEELKTSF